MGVEAQGCRMVDLGGFASAQGAAHGRGCVLLVQAVQLAGSPAWAGTRRVLGQLCACAGKLRREASARPSGRLPSATGAVA
jgi:hypothetical protein